MPDRLCAVSLPAVPVGQICVGEVSGPAVPWP